MNENELQACGGWAHPRNSTQGHVAAPGFVGGNYQLTSLPLRPAQGNAWQVSGNASGGGYALTSPYEPALRGSGCCCTYLPCMLRSW